ncbi:AarF/UbiB family protein [Solirubrobacter phytolaccae]|uniref:AarF/UbiB family protein n=1 Tax=Solirubrobacter phytolaccae TaxID=1404360 RepID=UPI0022CE23BC|nr:AarF/UbiB family protein [Solirubrobacter phytolaccae]
MAGLVPESGWPRALAGLEPVLTAARSEGSDPLSPRTVDRALRRAWNGKWTEVLEDLDLEVPVAVTPLAQVHRGRLDGAPVAVKVRRPGVETLVDSDLRLARAVGGDGVPDAVFDLVLELLDFEVEAARQSAARRLLRAVPGASVPAVRTEWCRSNVLVSEWMSGPTLASSAPLDPAGTARTLLLAHAAAARGGLVLLEPRPWHVVVLQDGTLSLLGAGAALPIDGAQVDAALARLPASLLGEFADGPALLDAPAFARRGDAAFAVLDAARGLSFTEAALAASAGQLAAVLARLEVRTDWLALVA